eukprot:COSAG06_NODE_56444_length_284_cov_1.670270_1_plen_51_part_01
MTGTREFIYWHVGLVSPRARRSRYLPRKLMSRQHFLAWQGWLSHQTWTANR